MRNSTEILYQILNKRGIKTTEEIEEFLSERPKKTYNPFLLHNMEAGVDLLLSEINKGTRICIYGDYDADGVTSICIITHILKQITDNFTYYIPSRFDEGYGLNCEAIDKINDDNVGLLLTVDCGSVSYKEVEYAKSLGMKVIVTDHHSIDDIKADCILINPKQKECNYPFKELAGCGIAFKMAQAIQQKVGMAKGVLTECLDLVSIGTIGDVVSLTDENRTIVKYGLNRINSNSRESIRRLKEAISLPWIKSENIAFGIAPHINAAGRMASAEEAVKLFLSEDVGEIDRQVKALICFNNERKQRQEDAFNKGMDKINPEDNFIVLYMDDIHEGIAGIVAGKIRESSNKPVIIVTPSEEGRLKGTGRSTDNVDLYKLLKKHENLFIRFGGHHSACGFLMEEVYIEELHTCLNNDIKVMLDENPDLFKENIDYDVEVLIDEITTELADEINKIEPVGQNNPKPVFYIRNAYIQDYKYMGSENTHIKFFVKGQNNVLECVLFKKAQEYKHVFEKDNIVSIYGTVEKQSWQGRDRVQLVVKELI